MRILHLFSNWRWTGPAEPAVTLAAALSARGLDVIFACGQEPADRDNAVRRRAEEEGVPIIKGLRLRKHFAPIANWRDARRLAVLLSAGATGGVPDLIHSHLLNDHLIALALARRLHPRPRVVRSLYAADRIDAPARTRHALRSGTNAVIAPCRMARDLITGQLRFPVDNTALIEVGIDTERFDPTRPLPDLRPEFGLAPDVPLVGIIARIQGHRRYPVFIEAVARAAGKVPQLRVLVLGRGPEKEQLALDPARRLGVTDRLVFSGYRWGDDFVAAVACFDLCVFLVPGTDGTCRAIREAMAMGKPVIAARRGIVPELIDHGRTGLIVNDSPENLGDAIALLLRDRDMRLRMGAAAREEALRRFPMELQAERVHALYQSVLDHPAEGRP